MQQTLPTRPCRLRLVDVQAGKGRGFVAAATIVPGTLLMKETPFFRFSVANKHRLGSARHTAAEVIALAADPAQFNRVEALVGRLGFHPTPEQIESIAEKRLMDAVARLKTEMADQAPTAPLTVDPQHMVRLLLQHLYSAMHVQSLVHPELYVQSLVHPELHDTGCRGRCLNGDESRADHRRRRGSDFELPAGPSVWVSWIALPLTYVAIGSKSSQRIIVLIARALSASTRPRRGRASRLVGPRSTSNRSEAR